MPTSPLGKTLVLTIAIGLLSGAAGAFGINALPKSENALGIQSSDKRTSLIRGDRT